MEFVKQTDSGRNVLSRSYLFRYQILKIYHVGIPYGLHGHDTIKTTYIFTEGI